MSKENFEKQIRKRMEQLDEINKHGIFKELKGTVTDFNYDTKSLTMTFEATKFHENAFGIMFGGSLAGMFDIAFGTLTAGLGDYSVAPTVQLSTTFLKGIPTGATVRTEVEAVSTGKTIMNFVGKAYVGEELVGSASGTFTKSPVRAIDLWASHTAPRAPTTGKNSLTQSRSPKTSSTSTPGRKTPAMTAAFL